MTTEDGAPTRADDEGDDPALPAGDATSAAPAAAAPAPAPSALRPGKTPKPAHRRSLLRELPGIVITAVVISVLIKTFLVQAFYIPSGSMENTLLVNDRVLVSKLADKPDEIHRGDIVVFKDPGGWLVGQPEAVQAGGIRGKIHDGLVYVGLAPEVGEEDLIKRVVGVGGDHVVGRANTVSVNGVELREPYVFPGDKATEQDFDIRVPEGDLWVMGDHRSISEDSRAHQTQAGHGFVPVKDVIGRAFVVVWPLNRDRLLRSPATFDHVPAARSGG
ncbi:MAG: signal peptidase [Actinomycetota bacterium]|jgi:signal peptidase I|nr:signal peptidase [Actinomycetota bacterium]